jgi:hypothetical protein
MRLLVFLFALLFCLSANGSELLIDGRSYMFTPQELDRVLAIVRKQLEPSSQTIYRVHVMDATRIELYFGEVPKHYQWSEICVTMQRIGDNWQVSYRDRMGVNNSAQPIGSNQAMELTASRAAFTMSLNNPLSSQLVFGSRKP